MRIYIFIAILSIVYIASLMLINTIPNIKIKRLGFFSLFGITIETPSQRIRIRKLTLRINIFKGRDSSLKLFNIELSDVEIKLLQSNKSTTTTTITTPKDLDLLEILSFQLSKRVYDMLFYYQILNQIHLLVFRCSVYAESIDKNMSLSFDYAKLENCLKYDGHNVMTLLIFNGYLDGIKDQQRLRIFRNIELVLSCDAIFTCTVTHQMKSSISNFSINVSLGKAHIPLDHFPTKAPKAPKPKESTGEKCHPIPKSHIILLRQFWSVFDEATISLDDFKVSSGPYDLSLATFQISLAHKKQTEEEEKAEGDKSECDLNLHVASLRLFEADTKCFELPSTTITFDCNPFGIIQGIENSHCLEPMINESNLSDVKLNITLTGPTLDIYHDQIMSLRVKQFRRGPARRSAFDTINFHNLLLSLNLVSTKVVVVDAKIISHIPGFGAKEFHRDSASNLILTYTVESISQRFACKNLAQVMRAETSNGSLYGLFKVKNFKMDFMDNIAYVSKCNLLATYNVHDKTVSLKLNTKKIKIKSINSAIFQVVKELRTRKILLENKLYTEMMDDPYKKSPDVSFNTDGDSLDIGSYIELFHILPEYITYVKVDVFDIQTDVICKDGLPSQDFFDEESQQTYDLKDYGRGISIKIGHGCLNYKKDKEEVIGNLSQVQCFTLSEFDLDYMEDFDIVAMYNAQSDFSDVSSLESITLAEKEDEDLRQVKKVFDVADVVISNTNNKQRDKNRISVKIDEINGRCDIFLVWCAVYASTLLKNFSPQVERACSKQEMKSLLGKKDSILKLDVNVNLIALVTRLPKRVDVLCELDSVNFRDVFENRTIEFDYFRSYVVHPKTKLWSRFLTMKESFLTVNAKIEDANALDIVCRGVRLNIPHGFLFYTVIDNIVTFGKAIGQITHNFRNLYYEINDFESIKPKARDPFNIATVNLKSKLLGVTLESDPFENEIGYIMEFGKLEQKFRIKKWKAFQKKQDEILANTVDSRIGLQEKGQKTNNSSSTFFNLRKEGTSNTTKPLLSSEEAQRIIDRAHETLEQEISISYIKKFKKFRHNKIKNWREREQRAWGEEKINDRTTDKFDVLNYLPGPLNLGGFFKDLDLTVQTADIDDLDQFLHDFGKGQPKYHYSILVPLHISIKSSSMFVFLRDYALPLLSFPDNDDPKKPAVQIEGNIVINEKLATRKEEMRYIWVPFSPPMAPELKKASFYSVLVPRTLTPVKFMCDVKCKIDSERAAMISWSKAYQAALSTATSALDNFTKPPIDDSPLGWWDKVSLLAHGRITFEIPNELCFHMKSSMDPYDLIGRNAGFVFCWKNNVVLKIDGNRNSRELVTLESDDFLLAIPNYSLAEKKSWSLFYDELVDDMSDIEAEAKKYNKRVMELSSDEKVQWTLGFLFERNKNNTTPLCDREERVNVFRPHYDVSVTSPYFEDHPDSYLGFRSDYLHMAISVKSVSKNNNSSNTIHLTPLTFAYFFHWWHSITEQISLPVRQGPLFNRKNSIDKSHVKMSSHLFTVKYQLILDPLTISHLYMHSAGKENNRVTFTGIKSRSSRVIVDLHQRKELLTYVNKKLQIENQIMHLKMNQAEISFQETDIRLVNAEFADKSVQADLVKYLAGNSTDSSSGDTGGEESPYVGWINSIDVHGGDFSWIDQEDFIELEEREVLSPYPKITIIPLCYTPRFTYVREFSLQDNGPFPFGNECTHNCQIGLERPEDTQGILLESRLSNIKEELAANNGLLTGLEALEPRDSSIKLEIERVKKEISMTKEKQTLIQEAYEDITGKLAPGETHYGETHSEELSEEISRYNSRSFSVYSGHRSIDEANRVRLLNKEASEFHNRFIVHNLQFKWNNKIRDMFVSYITLVGDRRSETYFMSRKAVDLVETVLNTIPEEFEIPKLDEAFCTECKAGEDVINGYDEYLDDIDNDNEEAEHKYLIKLVHPQIQLVSEVDSNSCALLVSKDLEMRIISVNQKGFSTLVNADNEVSGLIESRYGGLFNHSSMFVFRKEDTVITHPNIPYGFEGNQLAIDWPPWIECENIYEGKWMKNHLVTQRNTMGLTIRKPNYLYAESSSTSSQKDEIKAHFAKFVITADSKQYSTLFYVITDLLVHTKSENDSLLNKLDKIMSLADIDDFYGLDTRVKELQESIREFHHLLLKLDIRSIKLSPFENQQVRQLELEIARRRLELSTIMRGLSLRNMKLSTNKRVSQAWLISIDQIIWHFLDESRKPFIDLALADSKYKRVDAMDGSNRNIVEVNMIQGFNLQENAVYQELLTPSEESRDKDVPVICMTWRMLDPVGGIPIMQQAKLSIQPMKLQLDYETSKKLFEYIFPKDKKDKKSSSESPNKEKSLSRAASSDFGGSTRVASGETRRSVDVKDNASMSSAEFSPLERPKNIFKNFVNNKKNDDDNDSLSTTSSRKVSSMFSSSEDLSSPQTETTKGGKDCKIRRPKKQKNEADENDIALILSRSSKFISVVDIEVEKVKLVVSFKAPGHLNIIDVHNLSLNIPTLRYQNKTWSGEDFILRLRKDIIKVILQHTGQILGNKFKIRRRRLLKQPLKQIANYASFISVQDLQGEGKPEVTEDDSHSIHHHHYLPNRTPHISKLHSNDSRKTKDDSFDHMLQEIIDEDELEEVDEGSSIVDL